MRIYTDTLLYVARFVDDKNNSLPIFLCSRFHIMPKLYNHHNVITLLYTSINARVQ